MPKQWPTWRSSWPQKRGFIVEILNYHRHAQPHRLRLSVHPDRSDDGTLVGYTATQSNITEEKNICENLEQEIERRKKLEAELRYLSNFDALSGMPVVATFPNRPTASWRGVGVMGDRCR